MRMTNKVNRDSSDISQKTEALYWVQFVHSIHHFKRFQSFHFTHPSAPPRISQPFSHSLPPSRLRCGAFKDVDWCGTCVKQRDERKGMFEWRYGWRKKWLALRSITPILIIQLLFNKHNSITPSCMHTHYLISSLEYTLPSSNCSSSCQHHHHHQPNCLFHLISFHIEW